MEDEFIDYLDEKILKVEGLEKKFTLPHTIETAKIVKQLLIDIKDKYLEIKNKEA